MNAQQKFRPLGVWTLAAWMALAATAPAANVLQTFFVPLPEDDMQVSLKAVDAFAGNIGDVMESVIGMAVGSDNTLIYYDHWEDGYEADITSPTQLTSQVWGDADPANGYPPDIPSDVLDAGTVVRLEDQIDVTRNSVTIEYDGRDKVAVTQPIAMTRAMYPVDPGEVIAEAIGVRDIGSHGLEYRTPVGEGTGTGVNTNEMFSTSSLYIMGDYDFTRVEIDANADGVFEQTVYLDQGEPYFINGGVKAGATVRGNQPFQCSLITGDVGSNYETRWFELWPETQWDSDYFTPVCTRTNTAGTTYAAHVYLFNPNSGAITVTVVTATSTSTIAIATNSVGAPFQMPLNGGARFFTPDGSPFIGVSLFDTANSCQDYDWGISLVPEKMMSTAGLVGWGPGYGTTGTGANGNPVWVSALSNTTIYVDYDADPTTGAVTDPQGNLCDLATNVAALQTVRLLDTSDDDQTGLRYYTTDGTVLLGAWGEDSALAGTGNPYLDMGYAIPAFPSVISKKYASLLVDVNTNGYPDAGDTLEYLIDVINVGFATATHVIFEDNPPTNLTTYVTNSALLAAGGTTNAIPDSLPPKLTRFPFDEGGYDIGTIGLGQTTTVRYVTQIVTNMPVGFDGYIHNNATVGGTNGNWTTGSSTNVLLAGLAIQKQTSTTNLLEPGTNFTYTVTVVNTGAVTYTGLRLEDELPLGVTYVTNSARVTLSGVQTNTALDRFDERAYTNSNGTVPWLAAWAEGGEADGVAAGSVRVLADVLSNSVEAYVLELANANRTATRAADLSGQSTAVLSFRYLRDALDDANDAVSVFISTNNWTSSNLVVRLQGAGTDTAYISTNFNVSAYISTNTAVRFLSSATLGAADFVRFDDVQFTLTGTNATAAGSAPPTLVENLTLAPGGTATVSFVVMVDNPPVATQVVNTACTRADQQVSWVDSNPVTNQINATEAITLTKTSSTTNLLVAGTSVVYTIQIANTGTVWQTGIQLEDVLPFGMTYSNGTALLIRSFVHTNSFLDRFDRKSYTNSDGNVAWAGPWTEVGDDANPTSGVISIAVDGDSIPGQTYALRTLSTASAQRAANLSGYTNATLRFDYRRTGLEAGEFVNINVSANGGGTFTQIGQIGGATNDGSYFSQSYNISAYATTGTVIRFTGSAGRDTTTDIVWLDNIRIDESAAIATNALPDPPGLLDDYTLPPGTSMTVRLTATVDDPLTATEFINTARLLSDQQTAWLTSRVTNAATGSAGMKLTKWTALATNWDYGVTNDYYITIENTGTVSLTGIRLTDALPSGVTYVTGSAQVVQFLVVATNVFTETVSDGFGTAAYSNNDGTTNWLGDWSESEGGLPTTGNELIRVAGGTNALVFEATDADNDYVTRTNPLATTLPGRTYTNVTLSFAYRRQGWDNGDTFTVRISTNGYTSQSTVFSVPTTAGTDAGYVQVSTNLTAFLAPQMALRLQAGGAFSANDRINFDFVTFTNQGYDVATNATPDYSSNVVVAVVSNLVGNPTNLLVNYTLPAGTSVSVRIRGTLNVPLVATQFVNTATATNNQTPPQSALVTNTSVANSVGDLVWHDVVAEGVQSVVEPGLSNVVVRLYDSTSNLVLTTTSGVNGAYAFTNLPSGSFFLEFVTPSNYVITAQDQGGDDALDSDLSTNTGRTAVFALSGGTNDTTHDAGYYQPSSSLGNFVWRDVDGDGLQDGGSETGLPGVVVTLYDANSNVVNVTTTSATGAYSFGSLNTGTYFLEFTPPTNFTFTLQDQGGDDAVDSDPSPATGRTAAFYLPPGIVDDTRDAGFSPVVYGLTITKTSSEGSCLTVGATNTYTIVVQNTGTAAQASIAVEDVLPPGVTYVPGSVGASFYSPTGTVVSTTYNSSSTFTAPAGITSATVQAWGGGGGGASRTSNGGGGGGGGGAYSRGAVAVLAGSNYTVNVGGGGAANTAGGDSWFSLGSTTGALARGGSGGTQNITNGAAGGVTATGIGSVLYAGGNGGNGATTYGGGGGSSAGTNAAGNYTSFSNTSTGATAPAGGGNGGNGRTGTQGGGTAGSAPGGGGGGAYRTTVNQTGGSGAAGRVIVSYDTTGATSGTVGAPPNLWTGGTLGTGATVTITFQATVDSPLSVTQFINTASTYSAVQPVRNSSVTNCAPYADVGVLKTATKTDPDQVEIIEYILTVTNNGPSTATGVQITDVLPSLVQYNSHSNGTYSSGSGIWTIGTLGVGAATSLYLNVTVRENTSGVRITNSAAITARELYDPNPTNDSSSVVIVPKGGVTLGDRVWFDANRDGVQNSGETNGIGDVTVALMNTNNEVKATTNTSAGGGYVFSNMPPGTYWVRFNLTNFSTNVEVTVPYQGGDNTLDSDVTDGGVGGFAWTTNITLTSGQTNLTIDLGLRTTSATRAELAEIWGEWRVGAGFVVWRTATEWDTAGFRVYRVDPETEAETLLNEALVPSAMQEDGAEYALADPAAVENGTGRYRLEEAELTGGTVDHGTHELHFGAPSPAPKAARAAKAAPRDLAPAKRAGPSPVLKVLFKQEGLYGVSLQAIADGMGLALADVQALAEAGQLAFTEQGAAVPVIYDAAHSRLVFRGQPTANWYTRDNAVLIAAGTGLSMARREPGAAGAGTVFPVRERFEEDLAVGNATMTELPKDWYYWKMVTASVYPASNRVDFAFTLRDYAGGPVTLTVDLLGWTRTDRTPDHRAEFFVNGTAVGTLEFDDQLTAVAQLEIPEGLAVNGANTLTVRGALDSAAGYSYFVVDGFTAAYNRRLTPGAGTVHFQAAGADGVSAAAFTAPLAVALDEAGTPAWLADENGELPGKGWTAAAGEQFALAESAELPMLVPEAAAADAWFLAETNRIDYLVIASRGLAPAAQELADYRAGQGLRTGVATFEDACDLFTGGLRTPEAVPALLAYAQTKWAEAPWLVVLAGNGHYDFLGVKSNEVNHLPPLLLATLDGIFAADGLLADANGDGQPDMAVGRLPARNAADLAAMIAKTKAFEAEFGATWQNQLVLATDASDANAGSFMKANDRLAALTDAAHPLAGRIDLDQMTIAAARTTLTNWFKAGAGFIHYTGHGGAKNWSAKNLLKDTDVNVMTNARKPVVVSLTCLAGRFEMPAVDNLGEALLQRTQGGAVAVWSPSGLSRNDPAADLSAAFYQAVFQEGCNPLGLAVLQARRAVQGDFFSRDTLSVYNLLGDPALRVAGNPGQQALALAVNSQPPEGGTAGGGGVYPAGARATLSAAPNPGWEFTGWSDGDPRNPRTVAVAAGGATYTALFKQQQATVTVDVDPAAGGTATGGGTFFVGETIQIAATANAGWEFSGWSDGDLANPRTLSVPAGGATWLAQFKRQTAKLEVSATPAAGGTVTGGGVYEVGATVQIAATPNPDWNFLGWNDGSLENPRTVTVPVDGATYLARFQLDSRDQDEALNRPGLAWRTGGAAPWFVQTRTTYDGVSALQSGAIGHGRNSWLETTVTGPGWISFWWKASSQASRDTLQLLVNGATKIGPISGESGWRWQSYWIAGPATLRWIYTKDSCDTRGADCGWLDQVLWWPRGGFGQEHDFDGDGLADGARYDPNSQIWYLWRSSRGFTSVKYGYAKALPAAADYDGDGMTDLTVYRPSYGEWFIRLSTTGKDRKETWGLPAPVVPVPGDYDSDGLADLAVFQRETAVWKIRPSGGGTEWSLAFGLPGLVPVPADYDGDGRTDLALQDPASGAWHILRSSDAEVTQAAWGGGGALPVPADYDGDGRADLTVFDRKTATWSIAASTGGTRTVKFGTQERNPVPVPADYDGDGRADLAVFFSASGKWYILKSTNGGVIMKSGGSGEPTLPQTRILYNLRLI